MLSSHPLKLWSHRYVCSNCSAWHWIIHLLFLFPHSFSSHSSSYTVSFIPCPPNFLSVLLFSLFVSVLFQHFLHFFSTSSAHSVSIAAFPSTLLFLLFSSSHSHSHFFLSATPPSPLSSLYLSTGLSALRRVSAITPLHLLIPVLIQPSTHSCLTSLPAVLTHTYTHTHTCRLHKCPGGCKKPSVSTHSHPLTVQENALCKRTGSINLPAASAYSLMLFS